MVLKDSYFKVVQAR